MAHHRWPWESKRLGPHHWVTRPWRPHRDRRVQGAAWLVVTSVTTSTVFQLQGPEASLVIRNAVAGLTALVLVWAGRAMAGRLKP